MAKKLISLLLCFCLFAEQSVWALAAPAPALALPSVASLPSETLKSSPVTALVLPRGCRYNSSKDSLRVFFDGNEDGTESPELLFRHFLVGLSLPQSAMWVNLKPGESEQIIDPDMARTETGRILLAADLRLKEDAARMVSPDLPQGKEYWERLGARSQELFGSADAQVYWRVWIVPGEMILGEKDGEVYIYKANLKVQLEQASAGPQAVLPDARQVELNEYAASLLRELILPGLTREVNASSAYAPLRQVYFAFILSQWFKQRVHAAGYYRALADSRNMTGLTSAGPAPAYYHDQYRKLLEREMTSTITSKGAGRVLKTYYAGGIDLGLRLPAEAPVSGIREQETVTEVGLLRASVPEELSLTGVEYAHDGGLPSGFEESDGHARSRIGNDPFNILRGWEEIVGKPGNLDADDCRRIANAAKVVVNLTPFKVDRITVDSEQIERRLLWMQKLTLRTVERLLTQEENDPSGELLAYAGELITLLDYCNECAYGLNSVKRIPELIKYRFSSRRFLMPALNVVVRACNGFSTEQLYAERFFDAQLERITLLGNRIEPSLYLSDNVKNWKGWIADKKRPPVQEKRGFSVMNMWDTMWKNRGMLSRLFSFIWLCWSLPTLVELVIAATGPAGLSAVSLFAILKSSGGLIPLSLSWWFLRYTRLDKVYKKSQETIGAIKARFERIQKMEGVDTGSLLMKRSVQEVNDALERELSARRPITDAVFVVTDSADHEAKLNESFSSRAEILRRDDVPFIYVRGTGKGSGAGFFDVFEYLESEEFAKIREQFPHLRNRSIEELRSVVILAGGDNFSSINRKIPLSVPNMRESLSALELALLNGYRASQKLADGDRGGVSVLNGDAVFIGDIGLSGPVTALTQWMTYDQVNRQGLGFLIADSAGTEHVWKFYTVSPSMRTLKNKIEREYLNNAYDFANRERRQMLGFTGITVFAFENGRQYSSLSSLIRQARRALLSAGGNYEVKFSDDFLVPLIMQENGENIYTYLTAVKENGGSTPDNARRRFYFSLFDVYHANPDPIEVRAHISHQRASFFLRMNGSEMQQRMLDDLAKVTGRTAVEGEQRGARDGGRAPRDTGGIDFRSIAIPVEKTAAPSFPGTGNAICGRRSPA